MAKTFDNSINLALFFRGDKDAVGQIVRLYRRGLELFIRGYVHDEQVAEDIASDAFVRLIIKKPDIKDIKYFKTYLFSVAKNLSISYLRKNKVKVALDERVPSLQNLEKDLIEKEDKRLVLDAINRLVGDYRSVLFLRYYEDMSVDEVAKIMKKNKKQVYNLLGRAKAQIKEILSEEGVFDEN